MAQVQYNSGLISVALITVSLDVKLADEIADSVLRMPGRFIAQIAKATSLPSSDLPFHLR